jgi:purine-nucleoside phosphorylase
MGIKCFAMSVITDLGVEGKIKKVTHEEIQEIAENAEPKLTLIMKEIIKNIK